MYPQINPTEIFREHHLALLEEAEERRLARRLRAGRETKARSTLVAASLGFLAALVVAGLMLVALSSPAHADTTFTVNSTADFADINIDDDVCDADAAIGQLCTLRAAIQQANATTGPDTIHFNISGDGVHTISPNPRLPDITERVIINGYTQTGAHPNSRAVGNDAVLNIVLNGANAGVANGLELDASNSVIRGLVINNFDFDGISVEGDANKIEGNFIGTNPAGTQKRGNGEFGVEIDSGINNIVGGTSADRRNLISGNDFIGVFLSSLSASSKVLGNYIGTAKGGKGDLGNTGSGVSIFGAANNTIGDGTPAGANTIAFNALDGVTISDFSDPDDANFNRVLGNSIFANVELGIDLNSDGPTPNDLKDPDIGPNGLQNKPVISSATTTGTSITIKGTLNSTPNQTFTIQFFSNRAAEPAGSEGRTFLGQKSVTTNANGNVSFTRGLTQAVPAGQRITATATGPGGNTSEFSAPRVVVQQ